MTAPGPVFGLPVQAVRSAAHDDRFRDGVLAPWWRDVTSNHDSVPSFDVNGLNVFAAAANKFIQGFRQAAPSGAWAIEAQLQALGANASDIRAGIFAFIHGGKGHVVGPFNQDNNAGYIGVTTASTSADWSSFDGTLQTAAAGSIATRRWYRITWDGIDGIAAQYSNDDGATWTTIHSRTGMSAPQFVGVGVYSNSGAISGTAFSTCRRWRLVGR